MSFLTKKKNSDLSGDKYYQKAGYQDSLLFNPHTNIIRYGGYEFFADQVGVKPQELLKDAPKNSLLDYANPKKIPASQKLYGTNSVELAKSDLIDFVPRQAPTVIPNTLAFVEMLKAKAENINNSASLGETTDDIKKPQNSRLGKANYSKAANVLTDNQQSLGGAAAILGS